MSTPLGAGFRPRTVLATPPVPEPVEPTDTERIIQALSALRETLAYTPPPPPQIVLPEPDLSAIVTAVGSLKPGADADDIARAIVARLAPPQPQSDVAPALEKITQVLKSLDFRMQAPTAMIGGGILHIDPAQLDGAGNVKVAPAPTSGIPKYYSGAFGTVTPLAGEVVRAVTCHATSAGTVAIFGGGSIPVPANATFFDSFLNEDERWVGDGTKTLVFTSTDSYYVRVQV